LLLTSKLGQLHAITKTQSQRYRNHTVDTKSLPETVHDVLSHMQ